MSPSSRTLKQNLTTKFLIHVKVDQRHLQLPPGHRRLTRNSLGSLVKFFPLDRCSFTYWDQILHEITFFLQFHDINLKTKVLYYLHMFENLENNRLTAGIDKRVQKYFSPFVCSLECNTLI